jgi:sugar lactone lactonase YvrE
MPARLRLRLPAAAFAAALALAAAPAAHAQLFVSAGTSIFRLDAAGNPTVFSAGGLLTNPRGIAFYALGNVYVANGTANNVIRITADGLTQSVFASTGLSTPNDLAFGPDGSLYVANPGSGTAGIQRYAADGTSLGRFGEAVTGTRGLDFGADGLLYVTSNTNNNVLRYAADGSSTTPVATFAASPNSPREMTFAADGSFYVVQNTGNAVQRYTASGTLLSTLPANGISNPQGLAVGSDGTVYVVNNSGTTGQIRRYNAAGQTLTAWSVTGTAFGASFAPRVAPVTVPEPGAAALALSGGLPLLGACVARRRRMGIADRG